MELAPRTENDEESDRVTNTILVDKRLDDSNKSSNLTKVVKTTGDFSNSLANEKKIGSKLHEEVVRAELRVKFLRNLTNNGVGTNRIETTGEAISTEDG